MASINELQSQLGSAKSEVSNPQSEIRNPKLGTRPKGGSPKDKSATASVQKMKSMVDLSVTILRKAKERNS
jgi:hypothetical protein